jgi:hypothetical protein
MPDEYSEDFTTEDLEEELRHLLKLDLISIEWDEDSEQFMFYMTPEQKNQADLGEGGD